MALFDTIVLVIKYEFSSYLAENTTHVRYKDQSVMLFREIICVYCEDHNKHINI